MTFLERMVLVASGTFSNLSTGSGSSHTALGMTVPIGAVTIIEWTELSVGPSSKSITIGGQSRTYLNGNYAATQLINGVVASGAGTEIDFQLTYTGIYVASASFTSLFTYTAAASPVLLGEGRYAIFALEVFPS